MRIQLACRTFENPAGTRQTVWNRFDVSRDTFSGEKRVAGLRTFGGGRLVTPEHDDRWRLSLPAQPPAVKPKLWRLMAQWVAGCSCWRFRKCGRRKRWCYRVCAVYVCVSGRRCLLNDCCTTTTDKSRRWKVRILFKPTATCRMSFITRPSSWILH